MFLHKEDETLTWGIRIVNLLVASITRKEISSLAFAIIAVTWLCVWNFTLMLTWLHQMWMLPLQPAMCGQFNLSDPHSIAANAVHHTMTSLTYLRANYCPWKNFFSLHSFCIFRIMKNTPLQNECRMFSSSMMFVKFAECGMNSVQKCAIYNTN